MLSTSMAVEAEVDPSRPGYTAWRVTAKTEGECQDQISRLMNDEHVSSSQFTTPAVINFADDPMIGWWRSLGHTTDAVFERA